MGADKKPSGAEYRRRKEAAETAEHIAALVRLGYKLTSDDARRLGGMPVLADGESLPESDGADDFSDLPDPAEAEDAVTAMELTRRYQLRGLSVAAKRSLTDGLQKRLKFIAQFAEGIGMTQQRADLEERVAEAERLLANVKPHAAVKTAPTAGSARPARSRGTRGPLRPVPPPPAGPKPE